MPAPYTVASFLLLLQLRRLPPPGRTICRSWLLVPPCTWITQMGEQRETDKGEGGAKAHNPGLELWACLGCRANEIHELVCR
ncbi:hypothetical protein B0I35DRAFT_185019 [Stachybotrys elegans]|uniref:Secreted protein n=1 Tax=Stachybotrys elegans TaxID=80388 RepID=A0A8K0WTA8_9HYPO|nr:hypothetical protein B0I35DRAFT_185019 [Stachybotrys elegans]